MAGLLGAVPRLQLTLQGSDGFLYRLQLGDKDAQGFTSERWEPQISRVFNQYNPVIDPRGPLAASTPTELTKSGFCRSVVTHQSHS